MPAPRPFLTLLLALGAAACGGGGGGGPGPPDFQDGFEAGLGGWTAGADVPPDPNRPGETVAWSISPSTEQASEGEACARYDLDGRQDDGTIWLARALAGTPSTSYRVRLSFDLWSPSESFNTIAKAAAYAGAVPPAVEADFDTTQAADLEAGWRRYAYAFDVTTDASGDVWIAVGISAVWETEMTYFVDDVEVRLDEP